MSNPGHTQIKESLASLGEELLSGIIVCEVLVKKSKRQSANRE
jgi:hypothetical protein